MEDPSDQAAIDEIAAATGLAVTPVAGGAVRHARGPRRSLSRRRPTRLGIAARRRRGHAELHVNDLLAKVAELGASDLHLTVGIPPTVRIDGKITPLEGFPVLNGSEIRRMLYAVLSQRQREKFEADLELDTSYSVPNLGRFRVNLFVQRDSVGAVMRAIPYEIVPLEQLGLPHVHRRLRQPAPRPGAGERPDRLGQVDDPRLAGRRHQHRPGACTS